MGARDKKAIRQVWVNRTFPRLFLVRSIRSLDPKRNAVMPVKISHGKRKIRGFSTAHDPTMMAVKTITWQAMNSVNRFRSDNPASQCRSRG